MNDSRYTSIPAVILVLTMLMTGCGRPKTAGTPNGGTPNGGTSNGGGHSTTSGSQHVVTPPVSPSGQTSNSSLKIVSASFAKNSSGLYDVNITVRNDGALPAEKFDFGCEFDCPNGGTLPGLNHDNVSISISQGPAEISPHDEKHFVGLAAFGHCKADPATLDVEVEIVDRALKKIVAKTTVQVSTK